MIPLLAPQDLNFGDRLLLWFTSPGCPPCKKLEPTMLRLYYQWKKEVSFARVSVDRYPGFAEGQEVTSVPTLVYYRECNEVGRLEAVIARREIEKLMQR